MNSARWRWQDWSVGFKSGMAVLVPLLFLLVALVSAYRLQQEVNAADADVRRAMAIQAEIQTLQALIAESATGVRGYLLTGRDDFLDPYREAREAIPGTMAKLRANIRNEEIRHHLERISSVLDIKLASLDTLRREGRSMAPDNLQDHMVGSKQVLDQLRTEVQAMYVRETELLAEYTDNARRALNLNFWVSMVTSLLVLCSGVAGYLLLLGGVVRRVQTLTVDAERLLQGEPLRASVDNNDELGLLARRLHNASRLLATRAVEAQAASEAKTQFLSRTSHELRTPLNAILGFAQLLEADLRATPHADHVQHIVTAGRHLSSLIDEVLDIARIEAGELKLALEPLALEGVVLEARDLTLPLARQYGIDLRVAPAFGSVAVMADRQRLRQVLLNLLSNAIKYNRPGGHVDIGLRLEEDRVWVRVRDTGVGIAAPEIPKLFIPFERLDAEHSGVEGTGLGLALTRELMLHMGGDVEVQSTPGQGSVFSLRLRRAHDLPALAPLPAGAPGNVTTGPSVRVAEVLAIEDNTSNLALLHALVARRPQWRLLTARDSESGLAMAQAHRPSLILLDLHLPGSGGEAVLAQLRADPQLRDIPVVIVSANALPDTIQRLRAAGARDYLVKPLDVVRFLGVLDEFAP